MEQSFTTQYNESSDIRGFLHNRRGRFVISDEIIINQPGLATLVLHNVLVLRAERMWEHKGTEFFALSQFFEETPEGHTAPAYEARVTDNRDGTITIEWLKSDGKDKCS